MVIRERHKKYSINKKKAIPIDKSKTIGTNSLFGIILKKFNLIPTTTKDAYISDHTEKSSIPAKYGLGPASAGRNTAHRTPWICHLDRLQPARSGYHHTGNTLLCP